jgi:hypothetical protein
MHLGYAPGSQAEVTILRRKASSDARDLAGKPLPVGKRENWSCAPCISITELGSGQLEAPWRHERNIIIDPARPSAEALIRAFEQKLVISWIAQRDPWAEQGAKCLRQAS